MAISSTWSIKIIDWLREAVRALSLHKERKHTSGFVAFEGPEIPSLGLSTLVSSSVGAVGTEVEPSTQIFFPFIPKVCRVA